MTKDEAIAIIKANIEHSKKPSPTFDTPEHDEYIIERFSLSRRLVRAIREYPNLEVGTSVPGAQPMNPSNAPSSPSQ
jgi:hypothetical protein